MRVLMAEDHFALASFVRKGLEADPYAVDVSTDSDQARAMATGFDCDRSMLGLNLLREDGSSPFSPFADSANRVCPILVLTDRRSGTVS